MKNKIMKFAGIFMLALLALALTGVTQNKLVSAAPGDVPPPAEASVDYFLVLDGIDGGSLDETHPGSIEVNSWSWGETNAGSSGGGGGGGAGKVNMQDFHFTATTGKSSPKLMEAVASGQHIKKATFFVRKAGGGPQDYIKITLSDILVSSYQVGGDTIIGPEDAVSLSFQKIEFDYFPQNSDGSLDAPIHGGWDLKKGTKI